jgi:bifunctional non-homologous end joining protein LigD
VSTRFIKPCQPSYSTEVPVGPAWVYEIKHDGYRFIACKSDDKVQVFSRQGRDWTERVPLIVAGMKALPTRSAILDGECVVCDDRGIADFDALRAALAAKRPSAAFLYAFDLLEHNGADLRGLPWEERRQRLMPLVRMTSPGILLSEHTEGDGEVLFRHACAMGLEGLVAKRRQSRYRSGLSKDWLKIKNRASPAFSRVQEAFKREP